MKFNKKKQKKHTRSTRRSLAGEQNKSLKVSSHRSCYLSQPRHRLGSGQSHRQRK